MAFQDDIQANITQAREIAAEYTAAAAEAATSAQSLATFILNTTLNPITNFNVESPFNNFNQMNAQIEGFIQEYLADADAVKATFDNLDAQFEAQMEALLQIQVPDSSARIGALQAKIDGLENDVTEFIDVLREIALASINPLAGDPDVSIPAFTRETEVNLWGRARDRMNRQLSQQREDAVDLFASRGFSLPAGILAETDRRLRIEAQDRMLEVNRDIGVESMKSHIDAAGRQLTAKIDAAKSASQIFVEMTDATVRNQVEIEKVLLQSVSVLVELRSRAITSLAEYLTAKVRASAFMLDPTARVLEARINAFNVLGNLYQAHVSAQRINADVQLANNQALIEADRNFLTALVQGKQVAVQAALGASDAYAGIAGSALTSLTNIVSGAVTSEAT